jgi:hypothetical protein
MPHNAAESIRRLKRWKSDQSDWRTQSVSNRFLPDLAVVFPTDGGARQESQVSEQERVLRRSLS